jgi:hypothetical protein
MAAFQGTLEEQTLVGKEGASIAGLRGKSVSIGKYCGATKQARWAVIRRLSTLCLG